MANWKWSDENIKELQRLHDQGLTDQMLATETGRTKYAIQSRRKLLNLAANRPKVLKHLTDGEYVHLVELQKSGKTVKECVAILGHSRFAIQTRIDGGIVISARDKRATWSAIELRSMYSADCQAMVKHHFREVVREMPRGVKESIVRHSRMRKKLEDARRKLEKQKSITTMAGEKTMIEIAAKNGFSVADIRSNNKFKKLVDVRSEIAYAIRRLGPHYSINIIGRIINREHTTVHHAIRKHADRNGLPRLE